MAQPSRTPRLTAMALGGAGLEEGKHAAESGLDLKAYAEQAGKVRTTLLTKVKAWKVLSVTDIGHAQAREVWSQLAELHASPRWLWAAHITPKIIAKNILN